MFLFKQVNDKYGHDVGDNVLKAFAQILKSNVRKTDIVARWGGEEFVLLVLDTTAEFAGQMGEKLRKHIDDMDFPVAGKVTASSGVTHLLGDDDKVTAIKRADDALYKAKQNGRNRVEMLLE